MDREPTVNLFERGPDEPEVEPVPFVFADGLLPLDAVLTMVRRDGTRVEMVTNDGSHFYPRTEDR